jgi:hypothetical protein
MAAKPVFREPDFFIVGAPKCGTTAMAKYLAAHPDIFVARKEMHYFGSDLHFGRQFYRRGRGAYLGEFGEWNGQRRAGEASVWYLYSTQAAAEIKAFNPYARIIIMLREPVAMLHSLFSQFRFDGNEPLASFEDALAAEPDRRTGQGLGRQTYLAQGLFYREVVRYTAQVARYIELFGRDRVHLVLYDELVEDTPAAYRRVLEFLEVDPAHGPSNFSEVNTNRHVRNATLRAIFNDPTLRSAVLAMRPCIPGSVFKLLQSIDAGVRQFNSRGAVRQPLAPGLRRQLQHEFADEVRTLGRLLERDLSGWSRPQAEPGVPSPAAVRRARPPGLTTTHLPKYPPAGASVQM